ncbi:polyprenyl synthetase family protein [Oceanicoccus sagamiensis]|uniref:Geranyl transferase n=1 Tax=Oceanicoccus sagamiensis TaxID=716816 RepID=A0A1X9ND61_9GAMM|nr:farnesyl diphosphate synthase [Oceanicoccus sagamiensis]ARN73469.1 geranyl transferase [Oceanicoccus sagamiensis]
MSESFPAFLQQAKQRADKALSLYLGDFNSTYTSADSSDYLARLQQAMHYSLVNGGKRVRPVLVYAAANAIDPGAISASNADKVACAVEMIHAYSLIHDDLPAMDDDDLRRGQPTCHKAFDEATAILAGDALQSRAFELLTELEECPATTQLELLKILTAASGQQGMVGGQAIDLNAVDQSIDLQHLETIHRLKTGALIRAAVAMGATLAKASPQQLQALDQYAQAIGLAFQVQDDILDIESDTATLGKTQGADEALNKPTYPALLGLDGAKDKAQQLHQQALDALAELGENAGTLRDLSSYIISRTH